MNKNKLKEKIEWCNSLSFDTNTCIIRQNNLIIELLNEISEKMRKSK